MKVIVMVVVAIFFIISAIFSFKGNKFLKSIKSKLTVAVIVVAVVLVGVLSFVSVHFVNKASVETLANSIMPIANSTASYFDQSVVRLGETLDETIRNNKVTNTHKVSDLVINVKNLFPINVNERFNVAISDLCSFYAFDENGSVLNSAGDTSVDVKTVVQVDDIRSAMVSDKPVITKCIKADNMMCFAILIKTSSPETNKSIVVGVVLNGYALSRILESTSLSDIGELYLVDDTGNIIIHPTVNQPYFKYENPVSLGADKKEYKSAGKAFEEILKEDDGYVTFDFNDKSLIGGYSKVNTFNAKLVMISDTKDFTKTSMSALESLFFVSMILLSVAMISASLFANRISKPIVSTTDRIRELAQGNLTDPVDVWYSNDELGVLSNSLDETVFSLRQYINIITVALTKISEGDLCHKMEGTFKGDFHKIKSTFNDILSALSDTFAAINMSAEQVNSGAVQVSDSAQALSQGSTQQASAIEELSATLNDVSKQTQQNSVDAKNAYDIVSDNTEAINSCNDDMANMLKAMNDIHDASAEIAKIIKVIDEISFQTNILALNAAVEAAREGSKGFGVVADEVRRLASRSAEAAKQTAQLIENSSAAVDKGSRIAEDTASSLGQIVERSEEITTLMKNITESSESQADAIVQIDTGVDQISAVVSKNTSTAVGFASASEELSSQSLILKNMIARFRLAEETSETENTNTTYTPPANKFEYTVMHDDDSDNVTKQFRPTNLDVTDDDVAAIDLSDLSDFVEDDDDKY